MESNNRESGGAEGGEESVLVSVGLPLLALMIVTGALYLARDILIPLSAALVMGVVLSPIASRFERLVGRFFGAFLLVLTGVAIIAAVAYFTTLEMTVVADEVAGYSDNIGNKLAALEKNTPLWLQHLEAAVHDIEQRVEKSNSLPRPKPAPTVTVSSGTLTDNIERITVAIPAMFEFLVVVVLLFFLLYTRRDLRDRFVRLAARARITVASQAIETAGRTLGRYLLLLSLINLAFGLSIGLVLYALGLPNAEFWGLLAFLLRYVPYVGAAISSALPALVAFAVFPGWSKSLLVVGSFVVLDQITAQLVEPFLIGSGIDMSPVALLVATIYWSWLWGVPGLLLAIPLTACLKVAGEHIPALNFLPLLLGGERALESHDDFYRMLLELDSSGARALAIRYCGENGIEQTFDDIIAPAVNLAGDEHTEHHISDDSMQFIVNFVRDLIPELGSRFCGFRTGQRIRVAGICSPEEVHSFGLLMVLELFRCAGAAVKFVGEGKSTQEVRELTRLFSPDVMCLSCTVTETLPMAAELTAALKREFPHLRIIAGGVAALSYPADLLRAGCFQVCGTRSQTHRAIRQLMGARRGRPADVPLASPAASLSRNATPETKPQ
jgi:predicted PurR-regulated permease PerM